MLEFLNHVLPPEGQGHRCAVAIKDKRVNPFFTSTNEELAHMLRNIDGRQWNSYLACATFTDLSVKKPRGQDNVHSVKSFWLDLDVGKAKPYATYEEAKDALLSFCLAIGVPVPTIVCSGYGVHAWWTLEQSIPGKEWTVAADKFKQLTISHKLNADASRTADRSSILRPPQTLNWKNPEEPKEVYLDGDLQNFIPNALFMGKINPAGLPPIPSDSFNSSLLGGLAQAAPNEPSYGVLAVQRCGQLKSFRDLGGKVEEPVWYANLGVLAHCVDGEPLAQEWSSGHPAYNEVETERKLEQARTRSGPTTCARFKDLNPEGCKGCPFNVTSPIQLGKKQDVVVPPPVEMPVDRKLWLPDGFEWGNNLAIMARIKDPLAEPDEHKYILVEVCPFPFQIDNIRIKETNGTAGSQSVLISTRTPHMPWSSFTADISELTGSNWQAVLADKGVRCVSGAEKPFKSLVNKMIDARLKMEKPDTCYSSFGWRNGRTQFIAGRKMYYKFGSKEVSGTEEFETRAGKLVPSPGADFNKWRGLANKLFTPGCESQAFPFLCSFAAPLMDLMFANDEGGGIVSLVSHGSGRGKSTMLAAVESVWGTVNGSLRITEAESVAAKFKSIGILKNLPVVIDEWGSEDAGITRLLVTQFTGGRDKNRLTQAGKSTSEPLTWKTILIGTTNRPMVDQLRSSNDHAQANRIFEVPLIVPDYILNTHSATLNKEFEKCYGLAGPVFIAHLLNNFDLSDLEKRATALLESFALKLKLDNNYRYNLRTIAAVAVAAQILTTPDKTTGEPMLDFTPSAIIQWALDVVAESARNKDGKTTYEEQACEFIRNHTPDFVIVDGPFNPKVPVQLYNRPAYKSVKGRYEKKNGRIFIPSTLMREFALKVKIPYPEFCAALMGSGLLLQRNRSTLLSAGVVAMSPVKMSCWEIDATHKALTDVNEAFEEFLPMNDKGNKIAKPEEGE
jgi:hypothetical protein